MRLTNFRLSVLHCRAKPLPPKARAVIPGGVRGRVECSPEATLTTPPGPPGLDVGNCMYMAVGDSDPDIDAHMCAIAQEFRIDTASHEPPSPYTFKFQQLRYST
eukprot:1979354-Rhodomonas_salina.1